MSHELHNAEEARQCEAPSAQAAIHTEPTVAPMQRTEVDALLATLKNQAGRRKQSRIASLVTGSILLFSLVAGIGFFLLSSYAVGHWATCTVDLSHLATILEGHAHAKTANITIGGGGIIAALLLIGSYSFAKTAMKRQSKTTRWLAQFQDVRAVGPLAESLELGDEELRPVAEDALQPLLLRLQASDAQSLSAEHHAAPSTARATLSRSPFSKPMSR